jgi:hypothetical protein
MDAIYLMTMSAAALALFAALVRGIEASRRHVVCVRLEHELRRSADRETTTVVGGPR